MLPSIVSCVICLNVTDGNQSLLDHIEVPKGKKKKKKGEQKLVQVSVGLQRNQSQEEHKDLPQDVNHHHLERLQQESGLAPRDSIEESADREADLVLCRTVADETPTNESLVENTAEHFTHGRLTPDNPTSGASVDLSSQLEEVLQVDNPSFSNDLLVQPCVHSSQEDVKPLQHKSSKMEMESLYPQYGPHSPSDTFPTSIKVELKSEYSDTVSSSGAGTKGKTKI